MVLLEFCRKSSVILNNEVEKTMDKCTKFYKKMRQVHNKCQVSSDAKFNDFSDKDQHMAYLQDRLHEDEQNIQKIEIISEEVVKS